MFMMQNDKLIDAARKAAIKAGVLIPDYGSWRVTDSAVTYYGPDREVLGKLVIRWARFDKMKLFWITEQEIPFEEPKGDY